jgi:hypothetical protein
MEVKAKARVTKYEPEAILTISLQKNDQLGLYESDVSYEEAILLLDNLIRFGGKLFLSTRYINLDFYLYPDNTLEVEVFDERDGFCAIAAELNLDIGKKIIDLAFKNEQFNEFIPTTDKAWWTSANV